MCKVWVCASPEPLRDVLPTAALTYGTPGALVLVTTTGSSLWKDDLGPGEPGRPGQWRLGRGRETAVGELGHRMIRTVAIAGLADRSQDVPARPGG